MFGYVLPLSDRLSEQAKAQYRAVYCGLCDCLRRRYGFRARFLVNYDMTFLYLLLRREESACGRCFCPLRPFCKKRCVRADAELEYAADLSVLLSYRKLCDARRDGRLATRLAASCGMLLYRRAFRRASALHPALDRLFAEQLDALAALEEAQCASLDRPADTFAVLLKACAGEVADPKRRRILEQLLYHVGRYLYLTDALEDLPKDIRSGSYNPLCRRFEPENAALRPEDKKQLLSTVDASISMAASALELLEPQPGDELLRNIIYYGLPAVLRGVSEQRFRKRRRHEKKEPIA